jgi:hypothetical protein
MIQVSIEYKPEDSLPITWFTDEARFDLSNYILTNKLHSGCMPCPSQSSIFNHSDNIRWTIKTKKFLIVQPSPLPIRIPLGPKYSPQDPVNNNIVITIIIFIKPHVWEESHGIQKGKLRNKCLWINRLAKTVLTKMQINSHAFGFQPAKTFISKYIKLPNWTLWTIVREY